jgi:very-short-patch-repair endonuclease
VAKAPPLPTVLAEGPFTLDEARRAGITRRQLQASGFRRLGPRTYALAGLAETPALLLAAVLPRLPPGAAFSGRTAAWLHGLDLPPCDPIEVTVPDGSGVSARAGILVRRAALEACEVVVRKGMHVTSILRTLADLAFRLLLVEAVVLADEALHKQLVTLAEVDAYIAAHAARKGVKRLRRVAELAEAAAESQMESRLRLVLVLGGLPRPEAQVSLHDSQGRFLGRPDLFYRAQRLAIEFDGGIHRDQLVDDNRRQNRLLSAGIGLLRFTSADVYGAPDSVVAHVRAALERASAG